MQGDNSEKRQGKEEGKRGPRAIIMGRERGTNLLVDGVNALV